MFSFYDTVPRFLLGKYQLIMTVTVTAFFSIVALLLTLPFSTNYWFALGGAEAFGFTVLFFLLALMVLIISKFYLYRYGNEHQMTYLQYIGWNLVEAVVICIIYTFCTYEGDKYGIIDIGVSSYDRIFLNSLAVIVSTLGVPYVVVGLYFALEDKNNTIRLMNLGNVVGDINVAPRRDKRITLFDNSGVLKFSVDQNNLIYIESDDNYVKVWYLDSSGGMKQYMLRCRLKTIEESFTDSDLVRCHRKYIVNISKVHTLTSEKEGYFLDLEIDSVAPIPVSKSYEESVLARFNSR